MCEVRFWDGFGLCLLRFGLLEQSLTNVSKIWAYAESSTRMLRTKRQKFEYQRWEHREKPIRDEVWETVVSYFLRHSSSCGGLEVDFERFLAFSSEALRTSQKVSFLKRCACREFNSNASDENAKNLGFDGPILVIFWLEAHL